MVFGLSDMVNGGAVYREGRDCKRSRFVGGKSRIQF